VAVLFLSLAAAPLSAAQNASGAVVGTVTDVPFGVQRSPLVKLLWQTIGT